jgi:hypothetical protein
MPADRLRSPACRARGHRKSRQEHLSPGGGHSSTGVPRNPWNDAVLPAIVGTCRRKGVPVAAIDDALAEAQARHPHWGIWISSAGRYWATRRGNVQLTMQVHPGWAMTVDADSLAELETLLKQQ